MILSFADKETERIWRGQTSLKLPQDIQNTALRKLRQINRTVRLQDLTIFSGNRLEKLKGDREGQYSIRVNDQWRICFNWLNGNASEVEITDYH